MGASLCPLTVQRSHLCSPLPCTPTLCSNAGERHFTFHWIKASHALMCSWSPHVFTSCWNQPCDTKYCFSYELSYLCFPCSPPIKGMTLINDKKGCMKPCMAWGSLNALIKEYDCFGLCSPPSQPIWAPMDDFDWMYILTQCFEWLMCAVWSIICVLLLCDAVTSCMSWMMDGLSCQCINALLHDFCTSCAC